MGNWFFGDGVVGVLFIVFNFFKGFWDFCGDVVLIFIFFFMFGLVFVIIGCIFWYFGKGGKFGGDFG